MGRAVLDAGQTFGLLGKARDTPSADGTGKNYVGVTSAAVEQTIAKADQDALSITEVTGKKYGDADFTLETTGGSGAGAVTFSVLPWPLSKPAEKLNSARCGRFRSLRFC